MRFGRRLGWLLLGILLVMVVFSPAPGTTRWIRTLHNSAHAPIFGCIAVLMLMILRTQPRIRSLAAPAQYLISFTASIVLGVATEIVQGFTGRDASLDDAIHDVLGAASFLALFYVFDPRSQGRSPRTRAAAFSIACALLAFVASPIVRSAVEYRRRDQSFPVLADFSRDFDRYFIGHRATFLEHASLPAELAARGGERALRVIFLDDPYPGIKFMETPGDWTGYSTLSFDVTNSTATQLELVVRIDDAYHNEQYEDRFNKTFRLPPRTRRVLRIPLSEVRAGPTKRELDMRHIDSMVLFRGETLSAEEMYLSRAWLE